MTTTLHLALLTSHYVGVTEAEEGAAASGGFGAHKKDGTNAKVTVPVAKAAGKEETYTCRTSAEQLDSVARVLRVILQHRCSAPSVQTSGERDCRRTALHAYRVQVTKAVRDGAIPWSEVATMLEGLENEDETFVIKSAAMFNDDQPKLSASCLLSEPPELLGATPATASTNVTVARSVSTNTTASTATTVPARPTSRSSSRGRGSGNGSNGSSISNRRRASSSSSRRASAVASRLQNPTATEARQCERFVPTQLPPCEVVIIPAPPATAKAGNVHCADGQPSPSSTEPYPVFFLYHLFNEAEVTAALSALSIPETDTAVDEVDSSAPTEWERRRVRASQACALLTRAVWCTLRPVLRSYLHRTGATTVPSHLSVVWSIAEPALLEGLNSYAPSNTAGGAPLFVPCSSSTPVVDSATSTANSTNEKSVERWVRLIPHIAAYLYDPVALSGPGSVAVDATLAALQVDRAADGQRSLADAETANLGPRRRSAESGTKNTAPPRGGSQAPSSTHKTSRATGTAAAIASPATTGGKGRSGGNGLGDSPAASSTARTANAESELQQQAPTESADTAVVAVDFSAVPSAFPYCAVDATALACYLYAAGEGVTDDTVNATLARDQRGNAITSFLNKAAAYQRAVLATVATKTLLRANAKSSLHVTAELLRWMQAFLSAPTAAATEWRDVRSDDVEQSSVSNTMDPLVVGDVAKMSLAKAGLDVNCWPLPFWAVEAVPLATLPPLPLPSRSGKSTGSGGSCGAVKDVVSPFRADAIALSAFTPWASSLEGKTTNATGNAVLPEKEKAEVLLEQLARLGWLASSYAAWTQQNAPLRRQTRPDAAGNGDRCGTKESTTSAHFPHNSYTGGAFTLINGTAALIAEASRSVARLNPSQTVTALCSAHPVEAAAPEGEAPITKASSPGPSSSLFSRYRNPFQRLAGGHGGRGGSDSEAAIVPRSSLPAPDSAAAPAAVSKRCAVTAAATRESASVFLPPHPQEVLTMVRQIVAKNAGHFEVNTTRGTDTVTAVVAGNGGGGGVVSGSAMVDSTMTGSFSPAARQATFNTTHSTCLLLRQQQQQQRRRQRGQGGSSVATALRSFAQGVRLVKEVSKTHFGGRPNAEAAVLLQEALESTLATPLAWATGGFPASRQSGHVCEKGEKGYVAKVNALGLLQRYLISNSSDSSPSNAHWGAATTVIGSDGTMSAASAACAALQNLTPRVYEHCLQQVLLQQLLKEAGLERASQGSTDETTGMESWTVTQQVPTASIVPALIDFRERFGTHNVAVTAVALDYNLRSTTLSQPPSSAGIATTTVVANPSSVHTGATREAEEVHQTSAYAHNAVNVHPTRRVTQLWMVGVVLPSRQSNASDDVTTWYRDGRNKGRSEHQQQQQRLSPSFNRGRTRKWVDMVPRAGTTTPIEVFAVWRSLLEAELDKDNASFPATEDALAATEATKGVTSGLSSGLVRRLLQQYVQHHAEESTALVASDAGFSSGSCAAAIVSTAPMCFCTHETLYPFGDALLEVWSGEAQRTCRYIKATEVTAALHTGDRQPESLAAPLRLAVRWDDGLLFSCSTRGAQHSSSVPLLDVQVTTTNLVLQRHSENARLKLRRFANTSSCAIASGIAPAHESSGQPVPCPPQGLLGEVCSLLLEERTTFYCVHDFPPLDEKEEASSPAVEATIERSVEETEVSCEVDERTGVVRRVFASGTQLLQLPSGATLTRRPVTSSDAVSVVRSPNPSAACLRSLFAPSSPPQPSTQDWCETLITCDGRCFVRRGHAGQSCFPRNMNDHNNAEAVTPAASRFRRVVPRGRKDGQAPAFTYAECTYDAARHCHVRSRRDGLTVVEYCSLVNTVSHCSTAPSRKAADVVARVVVFPDGTSITTLAPREVRQRVLCGCASNTAVNGGAAAVALSSPSLCAMLEETETVERELFGPNTSTVVVGKEGKEHCSEKEMLMQPSVRWLVEAPTLPRFYLAPVEDEKKTAFAVVFGDGSVLQRHWVPAAGPILLSKSLRPQSDTHSAPRAERNVNTNDGDFNQRNTPSGAAAAAATAFPSGVYNGGTVVTLLVRPSRSAVRVLHQQALATIEPADVISTTTRTSLAAYAVGQGLPFFDFAYGGGMRLVDAARCVWEVRGLATTTGPKVVYPDRPRTYEELLRELVGGHYSPHRLPRAAELTYASELLRESATYARQRASGWCPPLRRRMRELSEPYIHAANLLRAEVLAPIEAAATAAAGALHAGTAIQPVCFGQLANGESIRYWCAKDILPTTASAEGGASVSAVANEPHVLQHIVPYTAAGGVLGYIFGAPSYTSPVETMVALMSNSRGGDCSALNQRLAEARRLSLLCVGGLAPLPAPSSLAATYAASLPPLSVLISHGGRWLPPSLQPPQQFSSAYSKSVVHAVASQSDVVWAQDAAEAAADAAAAYIQYVIERIDSGAAPAVLHAAVARRELRRHEKLAQLSHYHRVMTSQWPMEQPDAAREEQVRMEMRYDEQQRARQLLHAGVKTRFSPSAPWEASAVRCSKQQPGSRLVA